MPPLIVEEQASPPLAMRSVPATSSMVAGAEVPMPTEPAVVKLSNKFQWLPSQTRK